MTEAARSRAPGFSELGAVAATGLLSVALNRVPPRWELPAGIAAAGLMLALAHQSGAQLSDAGLEPETASRGLVLGLAVGVPAAAVVMAGGGVPAIRRFYHDDRVVDATSDDMIYHLFARIPFATAVAEEVIFRSALVGIFSRRRSPFVAAALSSALFGAWHILPSISRLHTNPGASAMHSHDRGRQALGVAAVVAATAVAGMGFYWLQWRSRSVVAPIVVHAAVNGAGLLAGWLGSRVDVRVGQDQP